MQKQRERSKQKLCEIQQNLAKSWQFEKAKQLTFTFGAETCGEIPRS
jgi:hypothetical protein